MEIDKTCGELSCDECNARYEAAMDEIDRLKAALNLAADRLEMCRIAHPIYHTEWAQEAREAAK